MSTAIVWFRRDLRLADQPALAAAVARHERIVPLFVHAPEEEGPGGPGAAQRWWLHHSLHALAGALATAGAPLVVRTGPSRIALADVLDATGASAVYWNRVHEPAAMARDRAIKDWLLRERGVAADSFNAALLHEPWRVATGQGAPYRVFTPFWKRLRALGLPDRIEAVPARIPGLSQPPASEPIDALALQAAVRLDTGLATTWTPGEAGAHARLARFRAEIAADYESTRDQPALEGTSALSPHLHFGEIGPRQIVRALREGGVDHAADAFLAELGWREFAHHILYHFPETPERPLDSRFEGFPWRDVQTEAAAELAAWQAGRTGVPLVDAGMRQLRQTGWMHNRVRMVVASFLTKNLRIDWREGARWFRETLVDADLANNTLGWQWTAGCGADAAPWFRVFNPVRQGERFDPAGDYVRAWVPELAALPGKHVHAPWRAPTRVLTQAGVGLGRDYPLPIVDLQASRRSALAAFQQTRPGTVR